ncbi:MAG: ABC transporter permease [Elusimicrobiota bacterium]
MISRILKAFFIRDFKQAISYRFAFVLDVTRIVFSAATFYFVAKLFSDNGSDSLKNLTGGYFPFVLIGIAFSTYQSVGLNSFAQSLRQEQYLGTLESVLVTPIRIPTFLAGSALWDFFYASIQVVIYFIVAFSAFGLELPHVNILPLIISLVLTLTSFMGLGILAAAFILVFKRGNPITWAIATAGELFGGVYFPTHILPDWMKSVSEWIPMTHALQALRQSLINGASLGDIQEHLVYLIFFTLLVWPAGIFAFHFSLQHSQKDGSLSHY